MKRICLFIILATLVEAFPMLHAQENERRTPQMNRSERRRSQGEETGLPQLTVRAQAMNELLEQPHDEARWMRVIYREVDLLEEKNGPLYYPATPMNGKMNLFATIFQLVNEQKLHAYEYLDGYEVFDEEHLVKLSDVLDRFQILYQTTQEGDNTRYLIDDSDLPSQEVKALYIKEVWYFDQNNSVYDVKTLAICPLFFFMTDYDEQRSPMFWVRYDELRPYISQNYIMTSNTNNAKTFTMDDYFRRRMFDGKIIKAENLLNIPLQAYCPTPDSMAKEQRRIETELTSFENALWIPQDSCKITGPQKKASKKTKRSKKKGETAVAADSNTQDEKETTVKEKKVKSPKAPKQKKEKAAPTRSIRRR